MQQRPILWLIDNDEITGDLVRLAFKKEQLDCELTIFLEVTEVMNRIGNEQPSILVIDFEMPQMSGFDFVLWLKSYAASNAMKIVLFSAHPIDYVMKPFHLMGLQPQDVGITAVYKKPFDFQSWRQFVNQLCEEGYTSKINE